MSGEDMSAFKATISYPKPIGTLKVNESFVISVYTKMPNRFHRMMAKILLGWEYKEMKNGRINRQTDSN